MKILQNKLNIFLKFAKNIYMTAYQDNIMNKIKDILLYISAFVPMQALILIKLIIELICGSIPLNILAIIYLVTLILLIMIGILGLLLNTALSNEQSGIIIILQCENITDKHFLGYFSLFVLFALQLNLTLVSSFISYILILFFIGLVYIKNAIFYINPFLNILGYSFYNIVYTDVKGENKSVAKFFYRGELQTNQKYRVIIRNRHFSFLSLH